MDLEKIFFLYNCVNITRIVKEKYFLHTEIGMLYLKAHPFKKKGALCFKCPILKAFFNKKHPEFTF
jgi:hypothetical protein